MNSVSRIVGAEKNTAFMQRHIDKTKPKHAGNSGADKEGKQKCNSISKGIKIVAVILCVVCVGFSINIYADCNNPIMVNSIVSPPKLTSPNCIKFADAITEIPANLYANSATDPNGGANITGVIGPNVKAIGNNAFFNCNQMTELSLPNVEEIGTCAFLGTRIEKLSLPKAKIILTQAFEGSPKITHITLPNILEIYPAAFSGCNALASVSLGTDFKIYTPISITNAFNKSVNSDAVKTENVALTLGEYVLPAPNISAKTWGGYTWKSITIITPPRSLTVNTSTGGSVSPSGTKTGIKKDSSVAIMATPDSCHTFKHWVDKGNKVISTSNPLAVVVNRDTILTAVFEIKEFNLNLNATGGGSAMGKGKYNCGTSNTIGAIPSKDHIFVNWTNTAGKEVSKENPLEVVLMSDTTLTANFLDTLGILEDNIYDISIVPNPADIDFSVIFDNTDEQKISIELIDISGAKILDIYEGIASIGKNIYKVNSQKLANETYFVKFIIKEKAVIRKVIVKQ